MMAVAFIGSLIGGQGTSNLINTSGDTDFDPQMNGDEAGNNYEDNANANSRITPESIDLYSELAGRRKLLMTEEDGEDSEEDEENSKAAKKVRF